ncbi:NEPxGxxU motif selenoprotein TsoC [Candidatus Magnetominusculus xianensis]|uniref:Thioredoxin-like fold domain-containing protein n=1 Tax=Candidatus Magnetominusculus xianensis TaxID=1748249 RepID=A0ABR5SC95_9BACT|nr:thioredoxin family protein [Candidatus Magnetominusculus xianensis]KWT79603.1 hypothetical protein ASN18_2700 [Candidatus Magnetominusculus xianensis]MBF0403816.1 thioredoxin family protein [Nitrospirota bacterium]
MIVRLYLNDPPGRRCTLIHTSIEQLRDKYNLTVELVKKPDFAKLNNLPLLQFPAVEINGEVVFEGRDVSIAELEHEIQKRQGGVKWLRLVCYQRCY